MVRPCLSPRTSYPSRVRLSGVGMRKLFQHTSTGRSMLSRNTRGGVANHTEQAETGWSGIKAVCFDLDGTLYSQISLRLRVAALLARNLLARNITPRDLRVIRQFRLDRETARAWGETCDLEAQITKRTAETQQTSTDRVAQLVERWIYKAPLPILASMRDERLHRMLALLRRRGYRIGLLSDYPARDKLRALGLPLEFFDAVVEAGEPEVNSLKPNPKGFLTLCQRLQLDPHEMLYVGDRQSIDGAGARAVGMQFALCAASRFDRTQSKALTSVLQLEDRLGPCTPNKTPRGPGDCWLCGSSSHVEFAPSSLPENPSSNLVKITDFHYGQTGHLLKCADCGFVFADAESVQAIEPLYSTLVDPDYQESAGARERAFAHIVRRIREIRPAAKTLLDVGAGLGGFCLQSQRAGFEAEGVEPSAWAVAQGQTNGVTLHHGYFPDALSVNKKFDVITVLDVIEHVGRPVELLDACRKHLNPRGLLVVITPDIGSITARLLGRRWWHFRFAHIGYFSRRTMRAALGTAGFRIDAVEPYTWWFQSGYLLERVAQYVPGGSLLAKVAHSRVLRSLTAVELPVRLYDSFVFYATTSEAPHGA